MNSLYFIISFHVMLSSIPQGKRTTRVRKMEEIPMASLIKIWRPDVLPSLCSLKYSIGSLQPLYFSRSYLDAQ